MLELCTGAGHTGERIGGILKLADTFSGMVIVCPTLGGLGVMTVS